MLLTSLLTLHLIGLALGLGAATVGDVTILRFLYKNSPLPTELLGRLSSAIWMGLALLGISGAGLFALHPSLYLHSSGFLAKMMVVAALVTNGIFLHTQIPKLRITQATLLSGALSTASWYAAVAIAMFKNRVHLPLPGYLGLYIFAVIVVWISYVEVYRRLDRRTARSITSKVNGDQGDDGNPLYLAPTPQQWDMSVVESRAN